MADELVWEGETRFAVPIARSLVRDRRISWGAKGLFVFLWDCPKNWRPNASHLAEMGPDGVRAVRSRMAELVAVGGLRLETRFGADGLFEGKRWVLRAPELWAKESPLASVAENAISAVSGKAKIPKWRPKGLQADGSPFQREEPTQSQPVGKLQGLGVILANAEDRANAEKLLTELGGRLDLVRNAVAIVRARPTKNRPFVSSVGAIARSLVSEERTRDIFEAATAGVLSRRKAK